MVRDLHRLIGGYLVITGMKGICWIITVNDNFLMETHPEVERASLSDLNPTSPEAGSSFS